MLFPPLTQTASANGRELQYFSVGFPVLAFLGSPVPRQCWGLLCKNEGSVSHWSPALKPEEDVKPSKLAAIGDGPSELCKFYIASLFCWCGSGVTAGSDRNEKPSSAQSLGPLPAGSGRRAELGSYLRVLLPRVRPVI